MSFDDVQTYATIDGCRFMLCDKCYCFPDCVLYQEEGQSKATVSDMKSVNGLSSHSSFRASDGSLVLFSQVGERDCLAHCYAQ